MMTICDFMMKDHRRLDDIFRKMENAKKVTQAKKYFIDFNYGLRRHIVWEEKILFPLFEKKKGLAKNGPTEVMRLEHKEIGRILQEIHDCVAGEEEKEFKKVKKFEKQFKDVLSVHNFKEEQMLYNMIDQSVTDKERAKAFKDIENVRPEEYERCCE